MQCNFGFFFIASCSNFITRLITTCNTINLYTKARILISLFIVTCKITQKKKKEKHIFDLQKLHVYAFNSGDNINIFLKINLIETSLCILCSNGCIMH